MTDKDNMPPVSPPSNSDKLLDASEPDYYFENGYLIFTESYHLKRGYCCKNGCRHCPYGFRKKP
jgi:hypothetical protein